MNTGWTAEKYYRTTPITFLGCSAKQLDKAGSQEIWSEDIPLKCVFPTLPRSGLVRRLKILKVFSVFESESLNVSICCTMNDYAKGGVVLKDLLDDPSTPALRERSLHILTNNVSKSLFENLTQKYTYVLTSAIF
jgi:hypothetical protein